MTFVVWLYDWWLRRIIITMHEFLIHYRLSVKNTNIRTEPKHIVFLSQLLLLFNFFRTSKADNPAVVASENGTQAIVKTNCNNPKCNKEDIWYSQPQMPGLKIPAGNFLLSHLNSPCWGFCNQGFQDFLTHGFWLCLPQHLLEVSKGKFKIHPEFRYSGSTKCFFLIFQRF